MPFANLSGDPAQEFFADGLTENLLDALAQSPGLFVIARGATRVYRGKAVSPRAVAKDLGVRYVLEGSVQKSGDHIRVTAQLIDAVTDTHLLSKKYDRDLTDLFVVEDDLADRRRARRAAERHGDRSHRSSGYTEPRSLGKLRQS